MENTKDFVDFLQRSLVARCQKNPQYSLRSFANTLHVSPSQLSGLLNRRRPLTRKMIQRLGASLGLGPEEMHSFLTGHQENAVLALQERAKTLDYQQISLDEFSYISEWYHFAILELIKVKNFSPSERWIASCLGITLQETKLALQRLERMNILKRADTGAWEDLSGGYSTSLTAGFTSAAARKYQKQILEKSQAALESVPLERRDHSSVTMAISERDLPRARELIRAFRREMSALLEQTQEHDQVYQLAVSFFPISDTSRGEEQ